MSYRHRGRKWTECCGSEDFKLSTWRIPWILHSPYFITLAVCVCVHTHASVHLSVCASVLCSCTICLPPPTPHPTPPTLYIITLFHSCCLSVTPPPPHPPTHSHTHLPHLSVSITTTACTYQYHVTLSSGCHKPSSGSDKKGWAQKVVGAGAYYDEQLGARCDR